MGSKVNTKERLPYNRGWEPNLLEFDGDIYLYEWEHYTDGSVYSWGIWNDARGVKLYFDLEEALNNYYDIVNKIIPWSEPIKHCDGCYSGYSELVEMEG